jgi:non-specific serine/threonine protein kinase
MAAKTGMGVHTHLTSFVGRRDELDRLRSLIAGSRLVTITGAGGSGKTRLVEEFAVAHARSLAGHVAFAYLANANAPTEVIDVVSAAVGLRGRAGELRQVLVEYLGNHHRLLVLDNCEHVQAIAADLAAELLQTCPNLGLLATSRRPLLVPGEQLFPVAGLREDAAITLFTERATSVSPAFVLEKRARPLVADLCARLDGMPLAIELAAARARNLGLVELAERAAGHLADLGSEAAVVPARQRSLRATITWSHDLLSEAQRVLWRRLCIFAGGFTLTAAEHVGAFEPLEHRNVERLLGELVDQSMVTFDISRARYRVVEAMREYGLERLREAAEEQMVAARHRAWMVDRAERVDRRWFGPGQGELLDELNSEAANLRAALESSREAGELDDGLRMASASFWYWVTRGNLSEADRWFETFIGRSSSVALEANASWRAGYIAVLRGEYRRGQGLLDRGIALAEVAGDPGSAAYARIITCLRVIYEQSPEDSLALARATLADPAADAMCRCWGLIGVGMASFLGGDYEECRRVSLQGIDMCRAIGESWNQELHLRDLAYALWQLGELEQAEAALLEALRIDRLLDDVWHFATTMEVLGWVTVDLGRLERAATLLGIASTFWAHTGSGLARPWLTYQNAAREQLRARLGMQRTADALEAGARLSRADALAFAMDEPPRPPSRAAGQGIRPSPRELEIARLVAEGCANRAIAERLFLSPRTVEKHIENLMNKLGVDSRAAIAAWHAREEEAARVG